MRNLQDDFYMEPEEIVFAHRCTFAKGDFSDYRVGRPFYGLTYAIRGSAVYELKNGEKYSLCAGDVAFIPKGLAYLLCASETYEHYTVNFTLRCERSMGAGVKSILEAGRMTAFAPTARESVERHFARLAGAWQGKAAGYRMRAMAELYTLFSAVLTEHYLLGIDEASFLRVLPAKEYLDKHYDKEISVGTLANLCDMSETNFRRLFLAVFDKTALAYKNEILLLHACDLLSDNLYTVGEIAGKCGFRDANYFSRFFKKHMKLTPREYKARYLRA